MVKEDKLKENIENAKNGLTHLVQENAKLKRDLDENITKINAQRGAIAALESLLESADGEKEAEPASQAEES